MSAAMTFSNIIRRVMIISLYAASAIYILISLYFPALLVQYIQENQRETGGGVEGFWALLPGAIAESWALGTLWAGFVFALFFGVLIWCIKKFWPRFPKNEMLK